MQESVSSVLPGIRDFCRHYFTNRRPIQNPPPSSSILPTTLTLSISHPSLQTSTILNTPIQPKHSHIPKALVLNAPSIPHCSSPPTPKQSSHHTAPSPLIIPTQQQSPCTSPPCSLQQSHSPTQAKPLTKPFKTQLSPSKHPASIHNTSPALKPQHRIHTPTRTQCPS